MNTAILFVALTGCKQEDPEQTIDPGTFTNIATTTGASTGGTTGLTTGGTSGGTSGTTTGTTTGSSWTLTTCTTIPQEDFDQLFHDLFCWNWETCNSDFTCVPGSTTSVDTSLYNYNGQRACQCLVGNWICDTSNTAFPVVMMPNACLSVYTPI
jgi:hypothetical protein